MPAAAPGWGRARRHSARDETRKAIVDTALRLFDERGYVGVRVEDIAHEAGVSRATFYKHFAEREEILSELFGRLLGDSIPTGEIPAPEDDIEAHVVAILAACMSRMLENERLARFVYSLPIRHDAVLPGGSAVPVVFAQVQACLARAVDAGAVRADIPVERVLEVLGRVFEASMRAWAEQATVDPRERLAELASVVFRGVATGSERTPATAAPRRRKAR
jgi:AcrR family transcriptional regulator